MADGIDFQLDFGPLLEDFRDLSEQMQKRMLIGMVAAGSKVIRDEAVRLAPVYTEFDIGTGSYKPTGKNHPPPGTLKRAIYYTRLISECTPTQETWVIGVRAGKKFQALKRGNSSVNLDAFYAAWVEYGHFARTAKGVSRAGKKAGRALGVTTWVPPTPYMRPAFATKQQEAFRAMQTYYDQHLPEALLGMRVLRAA